MQRAGATVNMGTMTTSTNHRSSTGPWVLRSFTSIGGRAAASTLRPVTEMLGAAAGAGITLQRRAVDRVLESDELEHVITTAINSTHVQAALQNALAGDAARRLLDGLFDSGLLDRFFERLLASPSLWHMIDEIAASPAVTAAISQQGLGLADQVGEEVREQSRKADDWVERAARRLIHRPPRVLPAEPGM